MSKVRKHKRREKGESRSKRTDTCKLQRFCSKSERKSSIAQNQEFQTAYNSGLSAEEIEEVLTRVLYEIHLVQD